MPKYKLTEFYPNATVRLVYVVEAETEDELAEFQADWGDLLQTDIDYGSYAYTETIELLEE